ncbi:hypothetical protein HY571_02320 [Candidatus Micrarchaeota archaeon]|nr:hypothetical protein [Candidatus Micrarchaeota archaeon]
MLDKIAKEQLKYKTPGEVKKELKQSGASSKQASLALSKAIQEELVERGEKQTPHKIEVNQVWVWLAAGAMLLIIVLSAALIYLL